MGTQGSAVDHPDEAMGRPPSDDAPFSALAFKIMADQFVGSLTFCRIYRCAAPPGLPCMLGPLALGSFMKKVCAPARRCHALALRRALGAQPGC